MIDQLEINHVEIKKYIRNRYPLLMVDKVTRVVKGDSIIAVKNITGNETCYKDIPIDHDNIEAYAYPVTLIIESFCQVAGILAGVTVSNETVGNNNIVLFGSISDCVLLEDAYPGDTLEHHANIIKITSDAAVIGGEIWIKNKNVCLGKIGMVVIGTKPANKLKESKI